MGDRSIRKTETKKKKKVVASATTSTFVSAPREVMVQPVLITKKKKDK